MWNWIAGSAMGKFFGMDQVQTEGMKKDAAITAIKRDAGGDKNKTVSKSIDKLVMRGEKVGVAPEKGDDYMSFNNRVKAGEEQTKRNEKVQLAREKQKPEYGVGRYKNQGAPVTQNNVQQTVNTTFEIKLPTPGEVIDQ